MVIRDQNGLEERQEARGKERPFAWKGEAVRGLLFDMDGTLVVTRGAHVAAWDRWLKRHGFPDDASHFVDANFGQTNRSILSRMMPHLRGDTAGLDRLGEECEGYYLDGVREGRASLAGGVGDFLNRARRRGLGMAVASSAPRRSVDFTLQHFGLAGLFSVSIAMEDVQNSKPAPECFRTAAGRLGIDPRQCVVFEDSLHGLEAGRKAGCRTVALTTLHPENELREWADLVVPDFGALLHLPDWSGF